MAIKSTKVTYFKITIENKNINLKITVCSILYFQKQVHWYYQKDNEHLFMHVSWQLFLNNLFNHFGAVSFAKTAFSSITIKYRKMKPSLLILGYASSCWTAGSFSWMWKLPLKESNFLYHLSSNLKDHSSTIGQ